MIMIVTTSPRWTTRSPTRRGGPSCHSSILLPPLKKGLKTFQLVHYLTVFFGELGFKFCLKLKTLRRITSVPALTQICRPQEYLPHFSHQLSNKGQLDRVVRKISLSSNLGLLWIGPRPQKQGILTKNEKKGRWRNCDPGMIVQILQERAARLLTSSS